jgi:hypothetical protein
MRWVRYPGPGQFRGEGKWYPEDNFSPGTVDSYIRSQYLPVMESDEKPDDSQPTDFTATLKPEDLKNPSPHGSDAVS